MQAALKGFLILPPTPENKALFLSQWPLASLFGAITETGDKLNDLIVRHPLQQSFSSSRPLPPQVSSLNRVFDGVEGIEILQVNPPAPFLPARRHIAQAILAVTLVLLSCDPHLVAFLSHTHSRVSHLPPSPQRPDLVSVLPVAIAHPHASVRTLACRHVCRFFADDEGIAFLRQVISSSLLLARC